MRRLSVFALALFLALVGVQLVIGPELFAPYVGRDAALLWIGGALAGAFFAATWQPRQPQRWVTGLPRPGQMLLATGIIVALAAGVLQGLLVGGLLTLMLQLTWWLGLALMLAGAWWPGGRVEYAAPQVYWTFHGDHDPRHFQFFAGLNQLRLADRYAFRLCHVPSLLLFEM